MWKTAFLISVAGMSGPVAAAPAPRAMTLAELGAFPYEDPQSYDSPIDAFVNSEKKKPEKAVKYVIPDWVKKLNGAEISVSGFMVPFDVQDNGVLTFSLVKSIMVCCYGLTPRINENVMCQMRGGQHAKFMINIPIRVSGVLHVEEVKEDGYVVSLYSMDVEKVEKIDNPDSDLMKGAYQAQRTKP